MLIRSLGQEDSPGEGNDNLLEYSCLESELYHPKFGSYTTHTPRGYDKVYYPHDEAFWGAGQLHKEIFESKERRLVWLLW